MIILMLLGSWRAFQWYSDFFITPNVTFQEGRKIVSAMEKYHESIARLSQRNPIRKNWTTDAWDNPYVFSFNNDSKTFTLISTGRDRAAGTDDDVIIK